MRFSNEEMLGLQRTVAIGGELNDAKVKVLLVDAIDLSDAPDATDDRRSCCTRLWTRDRCCRGATLSWGSTCGRLYTAPATTLVVAKRGELLRVDAWKASRRGCG
jgi:hypothetical protein